LEFADIAGGNILEADPVGMGKTPISLGLAENNGGITLVICLKNLKIQWETQIKRFTGKDSCIWDAEGAHGNKKSKYHIVHFNVVDRFVSEFNKLKLMNLIIDEGTLLTNHKSIRTKAVFGDYEAPRQYPGIKAKNNYILTGTPLRNRPREMYTLLHFLDPDRFSNPKHFIKRYERGGFAKKLEEFDNLDELFERASELMIRRPKSIRPGDKKPEREELLVEMTAEERIEYDSFMNALFNKWETTSPSAAHMAPIRNFLFKIKWERLTEFIDKLLESDRPVLVFGIQQNHVEKIAAQYGEISAYVHGGVNDESERERIKQALIAGSLKVGAYTLATGGMGMDGLQKTISDTIFIDRSYVPADHEQAEGRTARDGQMSVPQMWYMTVVGTVEEIQREMLASKQGIFDQAVDGKTTDQIKASQAMKQSMFKEFVARLAETTGRTFKTPSDD
jgi:SNF2 family DNA or RNA helicase